MDQYRDPSVNQQADTDIDASLQDIMLELKRGETIVFDVGDNEDDDTDPIYDTLVMKGFHVKKTFMNGRHSIIVTK
jgi:hypothetical protein